MTDKCSPDSVQPDYGYASQGIRAILFDKDGTLIDFNATWLPVYQQAAELLCVKAGCEGQADRLMQAGGYIATDKSWVADSLLASGTNDQIFQYWIAELGVPQLENNPQVREEYDNVFQLKSAGYAPVIHNLDNFLERLQSSGIKLGVATMDDEDSAIQMLEKMNCRNRFDFVCGADSGFGFKPAPGMIQAFAKAVGVEPEAVMMVGDSPRDLRMGRNAGAGLTVGVLTGASSKEHLAPLADRVFDDISGILELVANQN